MPHHVAIGGAGGTVCCIALDLLAIFLWICFLYWQDPQMYRQKKNSNLYARLFQQALRWQIFSGLPSYIGRSGDQGGGGGGGVGGGRIDSLVTKYKHWGCLCDLRAMIYHFHILKLISQFIFCWYFRHFQRGNLIYFQVSNYTCRQCPFITYCMALYKLETLVYRQSTNIVKNLYMFMRASGASEVDNFGIFTY